MSELKRSAWGLRAVVAVAVLAGEEEEEGEAAAIPAAVFP